MKKLVNELTWSVSRAQLFQACPRAYYYTYYGAWGGWEDDASPVTRKLYILKNIKPLAMWAGSVVHSLIKDTLDEFARSGRRPETAALQEQARARMNAGWKEAVGREWEQYPSRRTNLFELYYGNGRTLPVETTRAIRERVFTCLESFVMSPTVREILALPYSCWKTNDVLDTFMCNDVKVWCALDFAYVDADGVCHVLDWKTGAENRATLRQQLACYALYAMGKWSVPLEKLNLHGIFLLDGGRKSDYPVQPDLLVSVQDQIVTSSQAMRTKLRDPEKNVAEEEDFPCTPSEYVCGQCSFREVCPAVNG